MSEIVVVGGGVFGLSAARALAAAGAEVTVLERGTIPHPDASSTDMSKLVRLEYGRDAFTMGLLEDAIPRWRAWNERFSRPLFHETGLLFLCSSPMSPGSFERDSYEAVLAAGYRPDRLDEERIADRFGAWTRGRYVDGFFDPVGGWVESGAVVAEMAGELRRGGVVLREGITVHSLRFAADGRLTGLATSVGDLEADRVIVAAGAWSGLLAPMPSGALTCVAQPVQVRRPRDGALFEAGVFPPWAADVSKTGWYGFCANAQGLVKVANHGPGWAGSPDVERAFPTEAEARFTAFLRSSLPALADAEVVERRVCFYCDSFDGDPWVAEHPEHPGLFVATGGSGHGFKMAPLIGDWALAAVEGRDHPVFERYGWRVPTAARFEGARAR